MRSFVLAFALFVCAVGLATEDTKDAEDKKMRKHHGKHHGKHHHGKHHHHHHHHGKHHKVTGEHDADVKHAKDIVAKFNPAPIKKEKSPVHITNVVKQAGAVSHILTKGADLKATATKAKEVNSEDSIVKKMKALEEKLAKKKVEKEGQILVNGPLPADFKEFFMQAVAHATGVDAKKVKVTKTKAGEGNAITVSFTAPGHVVDSIEHQAADPDSKLAAGNMHSFLVSKDEDEEEHEEHDEHEEHEEHEEREEHEHKDEVTPVEDKGIDIDTAMPYGDLEPFGREDTAQELTEDSIKESDGMVDQLERAEVAEEKRAVFRALTRLRGAAITSFDGVARSQTGNIDEYNKIHQWRTTHPLHHLADEESDISKWAFPDNADF